jgi:histidyl-tRNA synthetase
MSAKDRLLRARLPRGLSDRTAAEIRATERMLATIRSVYERYGFEPVETPLIEYTDALGKFLPDQDRPNEGVFSFQDDDVQEARSGGAATGKRGEWLSLRYDLTAPLARYVAENFDRLPKPYRSYRAGWVFRNEKPGPGRFRQFMQFDADTVGAASPAADAEICMMAADTLEALGIPRGQYVIKVNSRKVLDGVMEASGLGGEENAGLRLTVLRAIDKLDRLGIESVRELLGPGRRDESGDYTKGAGLRAEQIDRLALYLTTTDGSGSVELSAAARARGETSPIWNVPGEETFPDESFSFLSWRNAVEDSTIGLNGIAELEEMASVCRSADYGPGRIIFESSVVRGLEYYTGPVFEADLLFEVRDEEGRPVRFGSVGGGGRYDGLVGRFMKQDVPATGFSVGVSRLQAALAALGKGGAREADGPVVVLVMDRGRFGDYQAMVSQLRNAGVAAELYLGDSGMRAQMKYADRRNAPLAIIQGEDEKARGVVQVKDLVEGKRLAGAIADHAAYREERPGQFEVAEAELVEAVKRALARNEAPG